MGSVPHQTALGHLFRYTVHHLFKTRWRSHINNFAFSICLWSTFLYRLWDLRHCRRRSRVSAFSQKCSTVSPKKARENETPQTTCFVPETNQLCCKCIIILLKSLSDYDMDILLLLLLFWVIIYGVVWKLALQDGYF